MADAVLIYELRRATRALALEVPQAVHEHYAPMVERLMELVSTRAEHLESLKSEFLRLAATEGNDPIRVSRMHFSEWADRVNECLMDGDGE